MITNTAKIKKIINSMSIETTGELSPTTHEFSKPLKQKYTIECLNNTGEDINEFTIVKIVDNDNLSDILLFEYPIEDDDAETTVYGIIQDLTFVDGIGHALTFGESFINIDSEAETPIKTGDKLYPLLNTLKGLAGSKSNGITDLLDICIGRAISNQDIDSTLVKVNFYNIGSNNGGIKLVRVASTGNLDLNGFSSIDGITVEEDDLVLAKNQTTAADRGVYKVKEGDWEFIEQSEVVTVKSGTLGARLIYMLTSDNVYSANHAVYG